MANTISLVHGEGNIEILDWREENTIKNLDLFSEIVLELKITKNLDNASLTFDAGEFVSSNKNINSAQNFNVSLSNSNGEILNSAIKFSSIRSKKFKWYQINISQKELKWNKFYNEDTFYLKITYNIPNYVQNENIFPLIPIDSDKTIIIGTGCSGNNFCPKPTNIYKEFILPQKIILKGYSEDGNTLHTNNGGLGLYWNDFTIDKTKNNYKTILIQYTDLPAERKFVIWQLIIAIIGGGILGAILSIPISYGINHIFYSKSHKNNKSSESLILDSINKLKEEINNSKDLFIKDINPQFDKLKTEFDSIKKDFDLQSKGLSSKFNISITKIQNDIKKSAKSLVDKKHFENKINPINKKITKLEKSIQKSKKKK